MRQEICVKVNKLKYSDILKKKYNALIIIVFAVVAKSLECF